MGLAGDPGPEGVGDEEAVEAVEDAGQRDGLASEGGAEGVDGAELGDEDLLLVEALPLALLRLLRAGGQRHALAVHVPKDGSDVNLSRKGKVCTASQSFNHHGSIKYGVSLSMRNLAEKYS